MADELETRLCLYLLANTMDEEAWLRAIGRQISFYLSDENLPKDGFLFHKTMRCNVLAQVSIAVLLTFNKLKELGCDREAVCKAVRAYSSTELVVSRDNRKVRRKRGFAMDDAASRTVRADLKDVGGGFSLIEEQRARFSAAGKVIRITIEGNAALVEMETDAQAAKAVELFDSPGNWRAARVTLLSNKKTKPSQQLHLQHGVSNEEVQNASVACGESIVEANADTTNANEFYGTINNMERNRKYGFIRPAESIQYSDDGKKKWRKKKQKRRPTIFFHSSNVSPGTGLLRASQRGDAHTDDRFYRQVAYITCKNDKGVRRLSPEEVAKIFQGNELGSEKWSCAHGGDSSSSGARPKRLQLLRRRGGVAASQRQQANGERGMRVEGHVRMAKGPPEDSGLKGFRPVDFRRRT